MLKRFFIVLFLPLILSGCSSTFAYNNLDWLLYWYLDDYVELDKAQKKQFDGKLEQWLAWHRKEELVTYHAQLEALRARIKEGPLSAQEWRAELNKGRDHWIRLRDRIAPELVTFAKLLSDEQVEELFAALEKDNLDEEEDRAESDEQERLKDRKKRIEKQLKGYVGKLSKDQKALVAEYSPQFRSTFDDWLMYRRKIQAQAKSLLEQRNTLADFEAQLLYLIANPEDYQHEQYKADRAFNDNLVDSMLEAFSLTLSQKQLRRIDSEIEDFLDDLNDLIND